MLGSNYTGCFNQLVRSTDWNIRLPEEWGDYFGERGECGAFPGDQRQYQRLKARAYGLLWFEGTLKSVPRDLTPTPMGIYTRDFSQRGCGLLSAVQIYPDETLRIVLATFWMTVKTACCRRVGPQCYEVGARLIRQREPSDEAFELLAALPSQT